MNHKLEQIFTIVVCTYNGEQTLSECLSSLQQLQFLHRLVHSIIVVDNNSTDHTKEIIHSFVKEDPIFKYSFEPKQGLSFARRHAIFAVTPWVIYVDDDNILDSQWLIHLKNTIQNNPYLGAINGAVIAKPHEPLNEEEQVILKYMFRNLACTHLQEPSSFDRKNQIPMGAGLCVKTKALHKIDAEGWLFLLGRCRSQLLSGEDTELVERILSQGLSYECNFNMKLYHLIPRTRLQNEYVEKLILGLARGRVQYLLKYNSQRFSIFLRRIKHSLILIIAYIICSVYSRPHPLYWKYRIQYLQSHAFLKHL